MYGCTYVCMHTQAKRLCKLSKECLFSSFASSCGSSVSNSGLYQEKRGTTNTPAKQMSHNILQNQEPNWPSRSCHSCDIYHISPTFWNSSRCNFDPQSIAELAWKTNKHLHHIKISKQARGTSRIAQSLHKESGNLATKIASVRWQFVIKPRPEKDTVESLKLKGKPWTSATPAVWSTFRYFQAWRKFVETLAAVLSWAKSILWNETGRS